MKLENDSNLELSLSQIGMIIQLTKELETTKKLLGLYMEEFKKFITYHDNKTFENHLGMIEQIESDLAKLSKETK